MTDPFALLTKLGLLGYAVTLSFGGMFGSSAWMCVIGARTTGSVTIGMMNDPSVGYHPTNPVDAARFALADFARRYPDVIEQ